ncbi:hypothetical protein [Pseudoruegeria sp. HB172150]|uniref:hypothetical protein n=1 Tax=Pseudoruegeria sp. HB172150 TaxID=2721164 RepID=UPI001554F4F4|nr:hypothetical protein [Pseudoruegeria sp. HB172150]
MFDIDFRTFGKNFLISIAIYPVVLIGVWALIALGTYAADMHMPADTKPLVYGLVFAVLTFALIDILGVATVVLALVSSANLIEYAQLLIPGRSASPVDFLAGLSGILLAATLVWTARSLVNRGQPEES